MTTTTMMTVDYPMDGDYDTWTNLFSKIPPIGLSGWKNFGWEESTVVEVGGGGDAGGGAMPMPSSWWWSSSSTLTIPTNDGFDQDVLKMVGTILLSIWLPGILLGMMIGWMKLWRYFCQQR